MAKTPSPSAPSTPAPTAPSPQTQLLEHIARTCHEVNRVLTAHAGDVPVQVPWSEYPAELKKSALQGVQFVIDHPEASPEQQHEAWCKTKTEAGWVHNGIYSAENKTHPHLRAYGALAPEVRLKDKVFRAIVLSLLR